MIFTRLVDNTIRISCSKNQIIDTQQLFRIYRTGLKLMESHGNTPVLVDAERNVKLSNNAQKLFNRLDSRCRDLTLIIIRE